MSTISKCAISLMRIWVENMLAQVGLQRSDLSGATSPIEMHKILMVEVEGTIRTPGMSPQLTFTSQIGPLVHASHSRESQSMKRLVILPYLLSFIIIIETEDPAVIGLKNKFFSLDLYPHARVGALLRDCRLSIVDC